MALTTKDADADLARIKKNIELSYVNFQENRKRFNAGMKFLYKDQLTATERTTLKKLKKPDLQFNIIQPFVSRLLGEWATMVPSIKIHGGTDQVSVQTIEVVGGILRFILQGLDAVEVLKDTTGGGYSVVKVFAERVSSRSMLQVLNCKKVRNPNLIGFDPMARESHKGDGQYCFELIPKTKAEFQSEWPDEKLDSATKGGSFGDFQWSYKGSKEDVILVAEYYEKCRKRIRLFYLIDGSTMTEKEYNATYMQAEDPMAPPPEIIKKSWGYDEKIYKYILIEDRILEKECSISDDFLYIFVDGNSTFISTDSEQVEQVTQTYTENAHGAQKLMNYTGQTLASSIENMMQSTVMADYRSIPDKALNQWLSPQHLGLLLYKGTTADGQPLNPPSALPKANIDPIIFQTFSSMSDVIQHTLGSYDAQLGINKNQLSGIAIQNAATQNNAVAMPYITSYLNALTRIAQVQLRLIPKYYNTPRTTPIIDQFGRRDYMQINNVLPDGSPDALTAQLNVDTSDLDVMVKAGQNFEIQKQQALQVLTSLAQQFTSVQKMFNTDGLPLLFENVDMKGQEEVIQMANQFVEQEKEAQQMAAQQGQQNNPQVMAAQLKQQELQLQAQKQQSDMQLDQAKLQLEQIKIQNAHTEALMRIEAQQEHDAVQAKKAEAENLKSLADIHLKSQDQTHRHAHANLKASQQLNKEER